MSMLFRRTSVIPVWAVVFGLFALSGSPLTVRTALVVLLMGAAVPLAIGLALWKETRAGLVAAPQSIVSQSGSQRSDILTLERRWTQWRRIRSRRHPRAANTMRFVAMVALTIGVVWASGALL